MYKKLYSHVFFFITVVNIKIMYAFDNDVGFWITAVNQFSRNFMTYNDGAIFIEKNVENKIICVLESDQLAEIVLKNAYYITVNTLTF